MGKQKKAIAKSRPLVLSITAARHIDEITGYIAFVVKAPANAEKVGDAIFETLDRIQQHPTAFRECEELQTKAKIYRRANCLSWQIIYKLTDVEIRVLGIMHHSRRPSNIKKLRKRS